MCCCSVLYTSISQLPQKAFLGTAVQSIIFTSCGQGQTICLVGAIIKSQENVQGWSGGIQSLPSTESISHRSTEVSKTSGYREDSRKPSAETREKSLRSLSSSCAGLLREWTISEGWVKEKTQVLQQLCAILRIFYLESISHYHIHHNQAFKAPKLGSHSDRPIGQGFLSSSWTIRTPCCTKRWIKAG